LNGVKVWFPSVKGASLIEGSMMKTSEGASQAPDELAGVDGERGKALSGDDGNNVAPRPRAKTSSTGPAAAVAGAPTKEELRWQRSLLPLMIRMLVGLTVFFFLASLVQLYLLNQRIKETPQIDIEKYIAPVNELAGQENISFAGKQDYARWRVAAILEGNALQRRYHQAGVLLVSRIWTRYLGFVTGTILALMGAAFILGKLRESGSHFGAESNLWKISVTSASPGIILAILGTGLMLATMATKLEMQIYDAPSYLPQYSAAAPADAQGPPVPLNSPAAAPAYRDGDAQEAEKEAKEIRDSMRQKPNANGDQTR
jgi:hypothetical protein